jgi:hypothetical protein
MGRDWKGEGTRPDKEDRSFDSGERVARSGLMLEYAERVRLKSNEKQQTT